MHVSVEDFSDATDAEEEEKSVAPHVPEREEGWNGEMEISGVFNVLSATDQAENGELSNYIEILCWC